MFVPRSLSIYRHAWRISDASSKLRLPQFGLAKPQTSNMLFMPTCLTHACQSTCYFPVAATSILHCTVYDIYQQPAGKLRQLYTTAMQMEVDFFSSQPGTGPPPNVGMLVVDFDDTCTSTDTISLIFNTAITGTQQKAPGRCMVVVCCQHMHSNPDMLSAAMIITGAVCYLLNLHVM